MRFNGVAASALTFVSATQLKATVPSTAGSGAVTVTNTSAPVGTVRSAASYTVTPHVAPTVGSFTPASGITGSSVTITGTYLSGASAVKFGNLAASFSVLSPTQIKATVPDGAAAGKISVTTAAGTGMSSSSFTPTLSITGFGPTSGPYGTVVTINGVGFTSGSTVKFNGVAASAVTFVSATKLRATVPATAASGPVTVTNTTAPAGMVRSVASYTVTPHVAPTVSSFTPTSGITGSAVTIAGTYFSGASAVKFGTLATSFSVLSATQIKANVPSGAVAGKISVTTAAGTATSAASFTPTLSITDVAPLSAPYGTVVTLAGVGFTRGSSVKFNGVAASAVTFVSATQLKATVPSTATTGAVAVTNTTAPIGTVYGPRTFTVTPYVAPTVSAFSPTSGITGSSVTIAGTYFSGASAVKFGTLGASFSVVSATQIRATVPNGAVAGKISVTTAAGTATSAASFTPTLSITGIGPLSGPPGTVVTIVGVGFTSGSSVKFNGVAASAVTFVSATKLTATVPSTATSGPVTVTNATAPSGTVRSAKIYTVT